MCNTCVSSTNCSACISGYVLNNNQCIKNCIGNTYLNNGQCLNCSENCISCNSSANCIICKSGYIINTNSQCIIPNSC